MTILSELWTREPEEQEGKSTYQYVIDLKNRLYETCEMAQKMLAKSAGRYKIYYDKNRRGRELKVNDKVLILLPTDSNKLLMQWKGPFRVTDQFNDCDYCIDVNGKIRSYHINLLKKHVERPNEELVIGVFGLVSDQEQVMEPIDQTERVECDENTYDSEADNRVIPLPRKESLDDVKYDPQLPPERKNELFQVLQQFQNTFTDVPKRTNVIECEIKLTSDDPVRSKPYPVPHSTREIIQQEVRNMLDMGIIERSNSSYSSPVVLVPKKDQTVRFCIDYRKLNRITVFDTEPMPNPEELFALLAKSKYLSKDSNKLLMQWKGPFRVTDQFNDCDYCIDVNGKIRSYHINLLKKHVERPNEELVIGVFGLVSDQEQVMEPIDQTERVECDENTYDSEADNRVIPLPRKESLDDVKYDPQLPPERKNELFQVLQQFQNTFTDVPKRTNVIECEIKLTSDDPVRSKPYPVPHSTREIIQQEVRNMLDMGIIERSNSSYSSPVVLVPKKDQTVRFCIDYRKLNRITVFDTEPMPNPEELFALLAKSKYLSKDSNKLLMQWKGPFRVTDQFNDCDYCIDVNGKIRSYHINLLKKHVERPNEELVIGVFGLVSDQEQVMEPIDQTERVECDENTYDSEADNRVIPLPRKESLDDVKYDPQLPPERKNELFQVLQQFQNTFTDVPKRTNVIECEIKLTSDDPVRSKPYPVPHSTREIIQQEVRNMLDMGIIERSNSSYSSPVVLVPKKDQTVRFCIDYRKLNRITVFDTEPMPNPEELFALLAKSKYLSKIDMTKGYW